MPIYSTSAGLEALNVSVRANFLKGYNSDGYDTVNTQIAAMTSSSSRKTRFPFPVDSGAIREHVGDRVINMIKASSQDLENLPYELTYGVDRDDLADEDESENAVALIGTTIRRAGMKYRMMPDLLLTAVLSSNAVSVIDGRPLFGTHYVDPTDTGSTSFSNTTVAALTPANLWASVAEMAKLVGPDGYPVAPKPTQLIVPVALEKTAYECVAAALVPNVAGTATQSNVLAMMSRFKVVAWPMLDAIAQDTWYLADVSDADDRGLIYVQRQAPEIIEQFNPMSEEALHKNRYLWFSRARGVAGGGNPMKIRRHTAS